MNQEEEQEEQEQEEQEQEQEEEEQEQEEQEQEEQEQEEQEQEEQEQQEQEEQEQFTIPLRINALDNTNDNMQLVHPDRYLFHDNENILINLEDIQEISRQFLVRRQEWRINQLNQSRNRHLFPITWNQDFWLYKTSIMYNSNRIISRWDSEIGYHFRQGRGGALAIVPISKKAFSNFFDIIEDVIDENIALKSIINAKSSDLEKLTLELEATKSSSNLNKLPEEVDKKISKYLGGKKTKKTLKRKTK